jgi:hypothetical protein
MSTPEQQRAQPGGAIPKHAPPTGGTKSPIRDHQRKVIERHVKRLLLKNTDGLTLLGAAFTGMLSGETDRLLVARVFGFDAQNSGDLDELVLGAVLNGLAEEDIEDIFRRFARRRGLKY